VDARPEAKTSHTLNPVPLTIYDTRQADRWRLKDGLAEAGLANLAATLLDLLGYDKPAEYEPSLIEAVRIERG
jgi:2,3-bisphosphoglycerate-independent phosphoglycerate mutase